MHESGRQLCGIDLTFREILLDNLELGHLHTHNKNRQSTQKVMHFLGQNLAVRGNYKVLTPLKSS